ncbi:MAG TPA: ComF family protein [Pyrinomonadaceae bacterium]|jgi:ComF family protein
MLQKICDSLLTLAYPQICHVCSGSVEDSAGGVVCRDCWRAARIFTGDETLCGKCAAFLRPRPSNFQTFCHRCDDHFYDRARAAGLYETALAASVLYLKREPFVAAHLKDLFISAFESSSFQDTELIMPVPLSKKRLLERGFNQAEILAEILAERFGAEIDRQSLARKVHTPVHRAGMDRRARELTVENAFEVTRPNFVKSKKILLVDDVLTSGATVSHCAKALKKKGADKVYVLTLARAV